MSELRASIAAAREHLIEGLCAAGFTIISDDLLAGEVPIAGNPVEHLVTIPQDFPFTKPKVRTPGGEGGMSWHRELDGSFCLWSDEEAAHLPWLEADAVLARVADWHVQDVASWPNDSADLDLHQYWPPVRGLVLHDDLEPLIGVPCRIKRGPNDVYVLHRRPSPRKARDGYTAAVVDVGELDRPLHNFTELCEHLDGATAKRLESAITSGQTRFIMVRYTRGGHQGSLGLIAAGNDPHDLHSVDTASNAGDVLRLRSGLDAGLLSKMKVAVVGVGAVGSLVADQLARSGVGALTLLDGDTIRPGNCVRHLASMSDVGRHKADAVRDALHNEPFIATTVEARVGRLTLVDDVETLFAEHDLIVDATGNGPATALILKASTLLDQPAISVCLQRAGTVVRVDRSPLRGGEAYAPAVENGGHAIELREGGCGDPVSPTPPWACALAAGHAVGMAVDQLMGRKLYPATLLEDLSGGPDGPPTVDAG
jgi:hypothetical protein